MHARLFRRAPAATAITTLAAGCGTVVAQPARGLEKNEPGRVHGVDVLSGQYTTYVLRQLEGTLTWVRRVASTASSAMPRPFGQEHR
jgi:hypothetical protein